MAIEFFNNGTHRCICFDDLTEAGDVQANQCLIIHGEKGMLIDPGGNKLFSRLVAEVARYFHPRNLNICFSRIRIPMWAQV